MGLRENVDMVMKQYLNHNQKETLYFPYGVVKYWRNMSTSFLKRES
jgi:hypothetical protein